MSLGPLIRIALLCLAASACSPLASSERPVPARGAAPPPVAAGDYGNLPLSFIENRGQLPNDEVAHYVQTPAAAVGFTRGGLRFGLSDPKGTRQSWSLAMDFVGGGTKPRATERREGVVSYFTGEREDWRAAIPTHGRIVYRDIWPGIDLVYRADGPKLKYELVVHPGADPDRIRLRWRGASDVSLGPDGSLRVSTPAGSIEDSPPVSFQDGRRIPSAYVLHGATVGFRLGAYDPDRPLVIDPLITLYAGYIGGASDDYALDVAIDAAGAAYVVGATDSDALTFPDTVGPVLAYGGGRDAFVAKVNPQGTALVYAGYIGGAGPEEGRGVAVDGSGAAYIAGRTDSNDGSFPETVGPELTYQGGTSDGFVAKVSPAGMLAYAGYIGGAAEDAATEIAVDASGAAYVSGTTGSDQGTFPVLVGPDITFGGALDGFVAKIAPAGTFVYAGYIGGNMDDRGRGIAVDAAGAAYLTGPTESDDLTFMPTVGPFLTRTGDADAFVAKVNPDASGYAYKGYLGGANTDAGENVAVDGQGAAYVTGVTASDHVTFPVVVGPGLTIGGNGDAFVAKVVPAGSGLAYAGYIGGSEFDAGNSIAVDGSGAAYVAGDTDSDAASFPEVGGPFLTRGGETDGFVAAIEPAGTLRSAGYLGGAGDESASGIAVDGVGDVFVVGATTSDPSSFPEAVGPSLTRAGVSDAYVAKLTRRCLTQVATILGTPGNDTITGTPLDDVILAWDGDDTIDGGGGNDLICAGRGNDVLIGGAGDDKLDGEAGVDAASFPAGPVTVDLAAGTATGVGSDSLAGMESIVGSPANDVLRGDALANTIRAGAGDDSLTGGAGDDTLDGEAGTDTASFAGPAAVTVDLAAGTASGLGADALAGIENLIGSDANDMLRGGATANRIDGGGGADRLSGRGGKDRLLGRNGKDRLVGGGANDRLSGGKGNDRMNGGKGKNDRCSGGKGKADTASKCEKVTGVP